MRQNAKGLKIWAFEGVWWGGNGAANQTNLETASLHSILDELEEWEAFLKAEPELIHKLRSFDEAAKPSQKPPSPARPRGPSL